LKILKKKKKKLNPKDNIKKNIIVKLLINVKILGRTNMKFKYKTTKYKTATKYSIYNVYPLKISFQIIKPH